MCGRYAWSNPQVERFRKYAPAPPKKIQPRYNRSPGQNHPILYSSNHTISWTEAYWGSFPSANSENLRGFPINARSETVSQKTTFQAAFESQRCLVPADGYYEWQVVERDRNPHFFHLPDRATFALAGLWREGPEGLCFTILTRSAQSNCLHIHHRMPVILSDEHYTIWMSEQSPPRQLRGLLSNVKSDILFYPVSKRVNATREDGPELLQPKRDQQSTLF
jgi:putative SOS response-associated peptidase YedK